MYVYQPTDAGYTVGFFRPGDERWITDSDHATKESAAARVAYLNGQK